MRLEIKINNTLLCSAHTKYVSISYECRTRGRHVCLAREEGNKEILYQRQRCFSLHQRGPFFFVIPRREGVLIIDLYLQGCRVNLQEAFIRKTKGG